MNKYLAALGLFFTLTGALLIISCNTSQVKDEVVIDVVAALSKPTELKASEYFKKVSYVQLETTDDCLIGKDALVYLIDNKILVTTAQKQAFLFDRTGRFITAVGHIGQDPGGYKSVHCWINDLNHTINFDGWKDNWVSYNTEGKFIENVPYPLQSNNLTSTYLDDNTYISQVSSVLGDKPDSIYIFNRNEILYGSSYFEPENIQIGLSSVASLSVLGVGISSYKSFGTTTAGAVMIVDYNEPDKGNIAIMNNACLWHTGGDLFYKPLYNDTIYQVKDRDFIPVIHFDVGEYDFTYAERFNKKKEKSLLITQILDSPENMFFNFVVGPWQDDDKRKVYSAIYSKERNEVKLNFLKEGITDDFNHFIPFQPQTVTTSGQYAGVFNAYDITTWLEENADKVSLLPKELKAFQSLDEEANPVVFILE